MGFYLQVQQREQKLLQAADDMRPLSGSSSQEDWMDVKLREKHRLQVSMLVVVIVLSFSSMSF